MKKVLTILFASALLAFASFGMANKYGFYFGYGYDGMLGGQYYLDDDLRLSLGITPFVGLAIGGSIDYILGRVSLSDDPEQQLEAYYGVGLGAGMITVLNTGVFFLQGHGMGGVEYGLPDTDLAVFGELGLGPMLVLASGGTGVDFGYDFKVGLLFK